MDGFAPPQHPWHPSHDLPQQFRTPDQSTNTYQQVHQSSGRPIEPYFQQEELNQSSPYNTYGVDIDYQDGALLRQQQISPFPPPQLYPQSHAHSHSHSHSFPHQLSLSTLGVPPRQDLTSVDSLESSLRGLILKNREDERRQDHAPPANAPIAPRALSQGYGRGGGGHYNQGPVRYYDAQRPRPRVGPGDQRGRGQRQPNQGLVSSSYGSRVIRDKKVDVMNAEEFPPLGGVNATTKNGLAESQQQVHSNYSQEQQQPRPLERSSPVASFKNKKVMTLDHAFLKPRATFDGNSRGGFQQGRGYHNNAFDGDRRTRDSHEPGRFKQENVRSQQQQQAPVQNRRQHNPPPQHRQFYTKCPPDYPSLSLLAHDVVSRHDPTQQEENEKIIILNQLQRLCDTITPGCQVVPFGSLVTGFSSANADLDLLLLNDDANPPLDASESHIPLKLAEEFLRRGFRKVTLLTQTRVPILKLTTPGTPEEQKEEAAANEREKDERIENARQGRNTKINEDQPVERERSTSQSSVSSFGVDVHDDEIWPPNVSCDIGFSKHLGIRNSQMLQTYSMCDPRVREMVMFVKHWAKQRDINTAYKGTLSSYGYVLLCLHYLINVVTPPILPNLQLLAPPPSIPESELFSPEGYNIWFYNDRQELAQLISENAITNNNMSIGQLLYEFFEYYSYSFKWSHNVLSLRTPGGIISKKEKGWTTAIEREGKFEGALYKDRYLICLEDPFETSHNVGRTCFGNGAYRVKNEFRRAAFILNKGGRGESGDGSQNPYTAPSMLSNKDPLKTTAKLIDELIEPAETFGRQKDRQRERKERNYLKKCLKAGITTTGEYRTAAFKDGEKGEKDVPDFARGNSQGNDEGDEQLEGEEVTDDNLAH